MSERELARRYRLIDERWPAGKLPMTDREAKFAARVIYRAMFGRAFTGDLVVKHRGRSWMNHSRIIVNSHQGWRRVIHDWSHQVHRRKHPHEKPHGPSHGMIEVAMIEIVLERDWLSGRLNLPEKPKPSKDDAKLSALRLRLKLTEARLKRWQTRAKRAGTGVKTAEKEIKSLTRKLERANA